jgi:hypothetical protein
MNCPSCGAELDERGMNLETGTARCFQCGRVSKLVLGAGAPAEARVERPAKTRVVLDRSRPGRIALYIRVRGGSLLLPFGILWLVVMAAITAVGLFPGGLPILVVVAFWLAGLGLLVLGLLVRFGITGVYIDREQFIVAKTVFGKGWTRRGRTDQISTIRLTKAYRSSDEPETGIGIAAGADTYAFGSFLQDDEKLWLISELRAFLREAGHPVG